ncbi:hypothetical protein OUZ56_012132 [Daphnia magna]|uniref:GMP synthase n=1 Tax=Daphnia magna TaxID=35525 RepID=A0ABQ9Z2C2_9CRUS|nr:hypothetical protein OUZ56_012132 [Daphnia magna]
MADTASREQKNKVCWSSSLDVWGPRIVPAMELLSAAVAPSLTSGCRRPVATLLKEGLMVSIVVRCLRLGEPPHVAVQGEDVLLVGSPVQMVGYARENVPVDEGFVRYIVPQLRGQGAGFWEACGLVVLRDGVVKLSGVIE